MEELKVAVAKASLVRQNSNYINEDVSEKKHMNKLSQRSGNN